VPAGFGFAGAHPGLTEATGRQAGRQAVGAKLGL